MVSGFRVDVCVLPRVWLLASLCGLTACVTSPRNDSTFADGSSTLEFTGRIESERGLSVIIQAELPNGTFIDLATTPVPSSGNWSVQVTVPSRLFRPPCGRVVFKAVTNTGASLFGLNKGCPNPFGPSPIVPQNFAGCATATIAVQRDLPATVAGNVALDGHEDAEAYRCVTAVQGNLSIKAGRQQVSSGFYAPGLTFSLPNLTQVSGNLSIDGDRAASVSLSSLQTVGGDLDVTLTHFATMVPSLEPGDDPVVAFPVTTLATPLLGSVGGDIALHDAKENTLPSSLSFPYVFGLDAVTSLGGSVLVDNPVFPAQVIALSSLTTIPGDLTVQWGATDLDSTSLLPQLTSVQGNFTLVAPPNARRLMSALTDIGGNATIQGNGMAKPHLGTHLLEGLTHVGGNFSLHSPSDYAACDAVFPSLESVEGTLGIQAGDTGVALGSTGATALQVGALTLSNTDSPRVPLHADARVSGSGAIDIQGNPQLCACQVSAFVSSQAAAGWSGSATALGNGALASCVSCPASVCN